MKMLASLIANDLRILYRSGYIWASVAVFALLLLVALQAARLDFAGYERFVAAIILFDVVLSPVMLVGLMVLLEGGEGAFAALCVTPLRQRFYIAARVGIVSVIAIAEVVILVLVVYDAPLNTLAFIAGVTGAAAIAALFGFVAVARFEDLYAFMLPMILTILFLGLPGYGVLMNLEPAWLWWHPTAGSLALIEAGFSAGSASLWFFGLVSTVLWLGGGALLARRAIGHIEARIGGA